MYFTLSAFQRFSDPWHPTKVDFIVTFVFQGVEKWKILLLN